MDVYSKSSQVLDTEPISEKSSSMGLLSIVIPAFNEEDAIAETVKEIRTAMAHTDHEYEIIVVDDGSEDRTPERARFAGVRSIRHDSNRGYGASLKTGVQAARGDWIIITDADGTYPNGRIPELLRHAGDHDMVVGARNGCIPLVRRPAKWMLSKLANYLAETRIPDINSGLRVFRKHLALRFARILPSGFSFTTTITLASLCHGYRVKYIPIEYHKRKGRSKIRPVRDTYNFFMLIVRTTLYFNPLKVFMPVGFILFVLGLSKMGHEIATGGGLAETSILLILTAFQTVALGLLADMIDKRL